MASTPNPAPSSAPPGASANARLSWWDRGIIILGAIATTLLTSYFNVVTQERTTECNNIRAQRQADVQRFRDAAVGFDKPLNAYMHDAVNSKPTTKSREAVINNLTDQRARLRYVMPYLDEVGQKHAKLTIEAIENFIIIAQKDPKGIQVGPLYQEYEYILENSQPLLEATNRATGMQNVKLNSLRYWFGTLSCSRES
jgi:hypothetical protein